MTLVERVRHHRHRLADVRARNLGLDRLELAANVRGRIRLRIPDIDVARPALQEDEDHGLGAAESARAFELRIGRARSSATRRNCARFSPSNSERPDAQQFAPRWSFAVAACTAGNNEHDDLSSVSMVVQKCLAVDQSPQQILSARCAPVRPSPVDRYFSRDRQFGRGRRAAQRRQIQLFDELLRLLRRAARLSRRDRSHPRQHRRSSCRSPDSAPAAG